MSNTPGLDRLRELNRRLTGLLADAQPGFFTWRVALSDTLTEMADYAGHGKMSEFPSLVEALKRIVREATADARVSFAAYEQAKAVLAKANGTEMETGTGTVPVRTP